MKRDLFKLILNISSLILLYMPLVMILLELFNIMAEILIAKSTNLSLILNRFYYVLLYLILIIFSDFY